MSIPVTWLPLLLLGPLLVYWAFWRASRTAPYLLTVVLEAGLLWPALLLALHFGIHWAMGW